MRSPGLTVSALACLAFAATPAPAHDGPDHRPPVPYAESLAHAPRPLPDRVVLTWAGDPATTQAVTWRTDPSVTHAVAELALANENGRDLQGTRLDARTEPFTADLGPAHYHSVEFTGLTPDTLYAYRVGDGVNWSEWFHFRTAAREAKRFTFVYFGDSQNDLKTHWSRVFREAFREAPRAAFTLHAGDLINRANRDAEWGEWFGAPAWVNGTIPVVPAPGNHEYFADGAGPDRERRWTTRDGATLLVTLATTELPAAAGAKPGRRHTARAADGRTAVVETDAADLILAVDAGFTALTGHTLDDVRGRTRAAGPLRDRLAEPGVRRLSRHWRPQFTLPTHGPAGLEESCYYLDYQGARIVVLNSNEQQAAQIDWLRDVLAHNPGRWTILAFHHPIFSPAPERDNAQLRTLWKPLIDEFKVDLVLTGHDHSYARSGVVGTQNVPAGFGSVYDPAIGTVYVVSVSGPKMYAGSSPWAVRAAEDTQLFQLITIDGDELRYEARTAVNRLYDMFTLRKRPGQPNELREALPPANRRTAPAR